MPRARRRLLLACLGVAIITALVNSSIGSAAFDAPVGLHWSASVVRFLRTNTEGLIVLVGFSLLLEFAGWERSKGDERELQKLQQSILGRLLNATESEVLVEIGLAAKYGPGAQALQRVVLSQQSALRAADIRVRVQVNATGVTLRHQIEFDWSGGDVVYAIASSTGAAERILNALDEVLECTVIAPSRGTVSEVADIIVAATESPFKVMPAPQTRQPARNVQMAHVSKKTKASLLARAGLVSNEAAFLLGHAETQGRLQITITQSQAAYVANTWWLADRPMEVRSMEIDASSLVQAGYITNLHFFMGTSRAVSDTGTGHFRIECPEWLVTGQGFFLAWWHSNIVDESGM